MKESNHLSRALGILLGLVLLAAISAALFRARPLFEPPLSIEAQPTGPRVIAQKPMEGQRLNLFDSIAITFDREMDPATGDSFAFLLNGQAIPGKAAWSDGRTFTFAPAQPLQPGTVYLAKFDSLRAKDGTSSEALALEFKTAEALVVAQTFPADGTSEVDLGASVTLIFNHPVVSLSLKEDQSQLPQPVSFSPPLEGKGEWVNSSTYVFAPAGTLRSGTEYRAVVAAGLTDTLGNALQSDYVWRFSTRKPIVTNIGLKDGEQNPPTDSEVKNVALNQAFLVRFGQPMDRQSVEAFTTMTDRESKQPIPLKFSWSEDSTVLLIEPKQNFKLDGHYKLVVGEKAQAADGGPLGEERAVSFAAVPYPAVARIYPEIEGGYYQALSVEFVSPMNVESLKGKILVSPAPPKNAYWDYGPQGVYVIGLEPGTEYVVRILPGMKDVYGNAIQDGFSYSFKNGDYPPYAYLLMPWNPLTYRADGVQDVFLNHCNLESGSLAVYPIAREEFEQFASGELQMNDFQPKGKPVREWRIQPGAKNKMQYERFLLNEKESLAPGYYFIGLQAEPLDYESAFWQGAIFLVATDNITLKTTATEALAWATDLESGAPQANLPVIFYDHRMKEIGRAVTNEDGIAYLDDFQFAGYAEINEGGRFAFTALYWGGDVTAYDFGYYQGYYGGEKRYYAYLYTDHAVYRPAQDVFYKGILRENDDMRYRLTDLKRVYVVAEQWGERIFEGYVSVSEQGSFSGKIPLAEGISLGEYSISAYLSDAQSAPLLGQIRFNVAEYRKPEYEVQLAAEKTNLRAGEAARFALDAAYYSGGALKGAPVNWFAEASDYYFSPSAPYSQYSFADWERDVSWYSSYQPAARVLAEGKGVTDGSGHLEISQVFDLGKEKKSKTVTLSANVIDAAGNSVGGGASVVIHASEMYAGIRAETYLGKAGEPQPFSVVALDWDSQPVAGQKLIVSFVERRWFGAQKKNEAGVWVWETSVQEIPVETREVVTGEDGTAQVRFVAPRAGTYKALVSVTDSKGGTHQASTYIWVTGGEAAWRRSNDRKFSLIADKDSYKPGETAEILIAQPFDHEAYALVTYERGHIYHQDVVPLKDNSVVYKVPITDEMAPAMYVSVTVVSGASYGGKPDFKTGLTRLNVDLEQKTIHVEITTDKDEAAPGDEVTYTIKTTDVNGKPVPADVSLAVVDKAVVALAPSNSAPLLQSFYSDKSLSVTTAVGIVTSADEFNEEYRQAPPDGSGSGGGGGGEMGVITARQDFKDTAAFQAEILTDQNGLAQVKVKLPENLTTWRADVRAVTADTRVGQVTSELVSVKPLFVNVQTPRFFVVNDQAVVGATVFNNTDETLQVQVLLEAQGAEINSDALQTTEVAARSQAYVSWNVTVGSESTRVDFTATARSGKFSDASKPALATLPGQGIPVLNFVAKETVGASGMIPSADSATEIIALPQATDYENARLSVEVSPSLAASMTSGLDYLKDYPYLCMEQTVSRFLPNVVTARAMREAGIDSPLRAGLDENVNAALQRIYAKQRYDGGWNWWDGDQSDPQTSAYVLYGLIEAREAGYPVSDKVFDAAVKYLQSRVPTLDRNAAAWEFNRNAFMMYALARADALQAGQTNFLFQNRASLDLYGKAFLAQAIHLLDKEDKRADTLLSDLASAAALSASGAHWTEKERDYWNWNTDARSTAIILNAFLQIDPRNRLNAQAVRWLMANREGGYWRSTQETAWSLIALTNWMTVAEEFKTDYKYAVGLNGEKIKEGRATKDNLTESIRFDLPLQDEINALVFARGSGRGALYYSASLSATLPVEQIQPLDQGMSVSREYFALDDPKTPITEIKRGELVKARLTVVVPEGAHYIVIDDPLPAGLEAVNASLLTDTAVPSVYTAQDYEERGWGWWYFTHIELRDEKVTLSADYLPAGTYVFNYIARAGFVGTFRVIPPTASEFYFPDVAGRGAGGVFTVKP